MCSADYTRAVNYGLLMNYHGFAEVKIATSKGYKVPFEKIYIGLDFIVIRVT